MYDIILEISHAIVKNGLNLSALGTVLFILLKRRRVKKVISRYFPWLAMEPEDVANYEARQIRIEQDVRAIKEHLGVRGWDAEKTEYFISTANKQGISSSVFGWVTRVFAIGARPRITEKHSGLKKCETKLYSGRLKTMKKLLSRKFLAALATGILIVLNDGLDMGLDTETIMYVVTIIGGWIFAEGAKDVAVVIKSKDEGANHYR